VLFNWRDRLYQWRVELNLVALFDDQLDDGRIRTLLRVEKETDLFIYLCTENFQTLKLFFLERRGNLNPVGGAEQCS